MSFKLPPAGSELREKFDMEPLVAAGLPGGRLLLPTFRECLAQGRSTIGKSAGAIKGVNFLCLAGNGHVVLVEVKRMSSKTLWDFGEPS